MGFFEPVKSAMLVAVLGVIERFILDAGGIFSIFLGFKLFLMAELKSESGGRFSSQLFNLSLAKVGPGVFFALFGAHVLTTALHRPINIVQQVDLTGLQRDVSQLSDEIDKLPDGEVKRKLKIALDDLSKMIP